MKVKCDHSDKCVSETCPHRQEHEDGIACNDGGCVYYKDCKCVPIDAPQHYTSSSIQPIEYLFSSLNSDEYRGFLIGNVVKYISRYGKKDGVKDLRKAMVYLNWLIEYEEKGTLMVKHD